MSCMHLLLTTDQERKKVFLRYFRRAESLKEILVRAKVSPAKKNRGFLRLCKKLRREVCEYIGSTDSFKSTTTQ